jgi:hypothetical protein
MNYEDRKKKKKKTWNKHENEVLHSTMYVILHAFGDFCTMTIMLSRTPFSGVAEQIHVYAIFAASDNGHISVHLNQK